MNALVLFLKTLPETCVRHGLTPTTLLIVVGCLCVIAVAKLLMEPWLDASHARASQETARKVATRFPRATTPNKPEEFLRLLDVHRPPSLKVALIRWDQDSYGVSRPILKLSFMLIGNDPRTGSATKTEKVLEYKVIPESVACAASSAQDMLRELAAHVQWTGKNHPVRPEVGARGVIHRPMTVLLPGEVRAA